MATGVIAVWIVHGAPAFDDNYIWIISEKNGRAAVVDPGDAGPVINYMQAHGLKVVTILITHKHYDHVGGIADLRRWYPDARVYGPANESISGIDVKLKDGTRVDIPGMAFSPEVIDMPGHTEGHIGYYCAPALFCGDTLFACGCGRVFSGSFAQLHDSLNRICELPDNTHVYCAHEYTLDNIGFAKWVEPGNSELLKREQQVIRERQQGLATVPSRLAVEKATNPFIRTDMDEVRLAAEKYADIALNTTQQVFTTLRKWKDREYD